MLRKITRRPSANIGPGCHVACPGTLKSKYRSPLPSELISAVFPCDVKNSCRVFSTAVAVPGVPATIAAMKSAGKPKTQISDLFIHRVSFREQKQAIAGVDAGPNQHNGSSGRKFTSRNHLYGAAGD